MSPHQLFNLPCKYRNLALVHRFIRHFSSVCRFVFHFCCLNLDSLFFFRFSGGRARARERRAEKRGRQPPARLACSVRRVVICESLAFCSTDQEKKRDCLWSTLKQDHKINYFKMRRGTQIQQK